MLTERETWIVHGVLAPFAEAIERVAVFGSRALGTARPSSDIDLALFGTFTEAQLARMWTLFDESSLAVTVDLLDYGRTTNPTILHHVDAVGIPLFTREQLKAAV